MCFLKDALRFMPVKINSICTKKGNKLENTENQHLKIYYLKWEYFPKLK
jgi:hypothetical protein